MGNTGSSDARRRRYSGRQSNPPPMQPPQPGITANRYFFAAAAPPYANAPAYYHYSASYPVPPPSAMPVPLPAAYDHPHISAAPNWVISGGRYACQHATQPQTPHVEHQKAVTIRNDVNLKRQTLRIEPDEANPGKYLVAFTFDATTDGSITIVFFAKEGEDGHLASTKESLHPPVTVQFLKGLAQKFRQPSGTGIDLSMFSEAELSKKDDMDVYPLAVKAEAFPDNQNGSQNSVSKNAQITHAAFEMEKGEYQLRAVKQVLWINGMRYELQEIYGIGTSVEGDVDTNDTGKECVICLSEPRDVTVLPCRHMCMCSGCAKVLRFQTNRCPICRQPVERLLEIKVSSGTGD